MRQYWILCMLLLGINWSCTPAPPVPKPRGYFRIELPAKHAYQTFDNPDFPYSFEYPVYAKITQDSQLVKADSAPFWINVNFPDLNATIFLSYKTISPQQPLRRLVEESYKLSYAHDIRADYIRTPRFRTPNGLVGTFYNVGGNAASAHQFFVTDTIRHFLRGALYFNVTPNVDSLEPAIEFLQKDMNHLVKTLRFKTPQQ